MGYCVPGHGSVVLRSPLLKMYPFPTVNDSLLEILHDEKACVPLSKLLPENRGMDPVTDRTAAVFKDDEIILKVASSSESKRVVNSFDAWLESFCVFQMYRGDYHPDLCLPLVAYANIVWGFAKQRVDVRIFLKYDRKFRKRMSSPEVEIIEWFTEDVHVMNKVLLNLPLLLVEELASTSKTTSRRTSRPIYCYYCLLPDHIRPDCPNLHIPAQQLRAVSPSKTKLAGSTDVEKPFCGPRIDMCVEYYVGRCVDSPYCLKRQLHVCNVCRAKEHRATFHTTAVNPP